jgi:hypothetical protein
MSSVLDTHIAPLSQTEKEIFVLNQEKVTEMPSITLHSPPHLKDLFPDSKITPFIYPGVLSMDAGLEIEFTRPPGLNFSIGSVSFRSSLNGIGVASCEVLPSSMSQLSKECCFTIHINPDVLVNPIVGPFHTFRSILRGALHGTMNGLLFGDWATDSCVVGIQNIFIRDERGFAVLWLNDLLDGFDFEYDIGKKAVERASDLSIALNQLTAGIIQQSDCNIM